MAPFRWLAARRCPAEPVTGRYLDLDRRAVKIVGVGAVDLDGDDVALAQWTARLDVHRAVDLGRVVFGAALGRGAVRLVDQHRQALADLPGQLRCRNLLLALHEAVPARFLDLLRHLLET